MLKLRTKWVAYEGEFRIRRAPQDSPHHIVITQFHDIVAAYLENQLCTFGVIVASWDNGNFYVELASTEFFKKILTKQPVKLMGNDISFRPVNKNVSKKHKQLLVPVPAPTSTAQWSAFKSRNKQWRTKKNEKGGMEVDAEGKEPPKPKKVKKVDKKGH